MEWLEPLVIASHKRMPFFVFHMSIAESSAAFEKAVRLKFWSPHTSLYEVISAIQSRTNCAMAVKERAVNLYFLCILSILIFGSFTCPSGLIFTSAK